MHVHYHYDVPGIEGKLWIDLYHVRPETLEWVIDHQLATLKKLMMAELSGTVPNRGTVETSSGPADQHTL